MLPVLFRVPEWFPILSGEAITSFGVMMMLALFACGWLLSRRMRAAGMSADHAWDLVVAGGFGGVIGAKLYYVLLNWPSFMADPVAALTSRGGLVWYGGLMVGSVAVLWRAWALKLPIVRLADLAAPPLALGYIVGRMGCFLVGDDYGVPTAGPLGIAFPQGAPPTTPRNLEVLFGVPVPPEMAGMQFVPVHPTQLYEVAITSLLLVALLAWERGRGRFAPTGALFALWLIGSSMERFAVEFLRAKDDRLLGMLTIAQAISIALAIGGVMLLVRLNRPAAAPPVPPLPPASPVESGAAC